MSDIDEKIKEALTGIHEGDELFADPNLIAETIVPFRGKRKWVNLVGLLYGIFLFVLAVWAGFKFFHAQDLRDQMLWGGLCFFAIIVSAFVKVFFWMEMHTNRILRELKRVELLVLQSKK